MKKGTLSLVIFLLLLSATFYARYVHARNYNEEQQLIVVGTGAFRDGFYDVAEIQFLHFIKSYPAHPKVYDIYFLLARTLLVKGKLKEARASFLKIVNENNRFECMDYVLFWLAEIEMRFGSNEEARKLLLSVIRRFPRFEWIDYCYYLMALLDLGSDKYALAEASFKKVPLLSKNRELTLSSFFWLGVLSFRQKDLETAARYFQTVWQDRKSVPRTYGKHALFWLGETHLKLGKFDEAKQNYKAFSELFRDDSLNPEVAWRLGFCEYRSGNLTEATEIFQALKSKLTDSTLILYTHYILGEIFLAVGDHPSSTKEINSLLNKSQANELSGVSLIALFWNFVNLGEMEEANKVFQRLQKLSHYDNEKAFIQWLNAELIFSEGRISDSFPYYFNIVNTSFREKALYRIGKGYFFENKFRDAITNLDILFLEFPSSKYIVECLFMKAECLSRLGNLEQAIETYDMIVRQDQNNFWQVLALTQMGSIFLSRNENRKAENAFKKVIEDFPGHPLSYYAAFQLGNVHFKRNNIAEAIQYYSAVLTGNLLELLGKTYFSLGEMFYLQGKYEKALTNFEAAGRYLQDNSLWFFLTQLEIGNLQRKWGRYDEAKKAYTIILNHSKDEEIKQAARVLLNRAGSH